MHHFHAQDGLASHWPEELTNEHVPKDWLLFKNAVPPAPPPPQCLFHVSIAIDSTIKEDHDNYLTSYLVYLRCQQNIFYELQIDFLLCKHLPLFTC